jgi:NAD(P)-dependent dehydrogenase (short-subunit alcohol dehydrogenase family)
MVRLVTRDAPLALEYAANNIRFNTVSPGNINTPMHVKDNHEALPKFHPLARMGEIYDIVAASIQGIRQRLGASGARSAAA